MFRYPLVDAATYSNQAQDILAGTGVQGPYWQPPGYLYVLALLKWMCGGSTPVVRAAQGLLLAPLLSVLTWRLARCLLPSRWSFAAGVVVSLVGPLVFYASQLLPAVPAAVLVTAALLSGAWASGRPSGGRWLLTGAWAGLSAVMVATSVALLPMLALAAWCASATLKVRARHVLALAVGAACAVLPVSCRNYAESGRWVWLSTNDGVNLYIGNGKGWPGSLCALPGLDWDALVRLPYERGGARDEAEASRWFRQKAARDVVSDPLGALTRLGVKAAVFWHGREIPRNIDLYGWRCESSVLRAAVWRQGLCFPVGLLVPLAAVGALAVGRRREGRLVVSAVVCFGLLVALFFPCSRYRVPVLPALVVLALAGLHALAQAVRAKKVRTAAWQGGVVIALGVGVNWPIRWPTDGVRYDAHLLSAVGTSADVCDGDLLAARKYHESAVRLDPRFADAHFDLGTVCARLRDTTRAEACYRAALASRPDHDKAHVNLALLLAGRGETGEALEHLVKAEALNPLNANTWYNHAAILLRMGRARDALEPMRRAAERDSQHRALYQALLQKAKARPAEEPGSIEAR